jgi:hypothetical protein
LILNKKIEFSRETGRNTEYNKNARSDTAGSCPEKKRSGLLSMDFDSDASFDVQILYSVPATGNVFKRTLLQPSTG